MATPPLSPGKMAMRDLQNKSLDLHDRIEAAIAKKDGVRPDPTPELLDLLQQQIAVMDQIRDTDPSAAACPKYEHLTRKLAASAAVFLY